MDEEQAIENLKNQLKDDQAKVVKLEQEVKKQRIKLRGQRWGSAQQGLRDRLNDARRRVKMAEQGIASLEVQAGLRPAPGDRRLVALEESVKVAEIKLAEAQAAQVATWRELKAVWQAQRAYADAHARLYQLNPMSGATITLPPQPDRESVRLAEERHAASQQRVQICSQELDQCIAVLRDYKFSRELARA